MRIIMIVSSLILVVGIHAMQNDKNLLNLSIIKCIRPANTIGYHAMLEKSRKAFPWEKIKEGSAIFQLIAFDEIAKQQTSHLKNLDKVKKISQLSMEIIFCPITLLKNLKEGEEGRLGRKRSIYVCNQKIIDSMAFEEKLAPFDCALQKEEF